MSKKNKKNKDLEEKKKLLERLKEETLKNNINFNTTYIRSK